MSGSSGKVVVVSGASGYIASWLVKLLLLRGYTVKASVRDPNDPKKVDHLPKLDGAKERLHLVKENLLEEGSFDSLVEGCEGVFHTASPFSNDVKDPQAWYRLSKTLAEDAAWKFVEENNIDMVVINPAMVIGPLLQPTLNASVAMVSKLVNDVANAHIQAFEIPLANGRCCLAERVAHFSDAVKILRELYPTLQIPEKLKMVRR